MKLSNVLITGASGQLGSEIEALHKNFPQYNFVFTDVNELDIVDATKVHSFLNDAHYDYIINCAAYTAVDKAEGDFEKAMQINSQAVKNLAQNASEKNITLIHVSTDYVFDGKNYKPYNESDPTNPLTKYGVSKVSGEQEVLKYCKNASIIRTSWLYSRYGANFVKTIINKGKEKGELNVVFDQIGTPTYAGDLAMTIASNLKTFANADRNEIFHFSNEGVASWYDFAQAIIRLSNIKCKLNPVETHAYPTPAPRPSYSVLNKQKIKSFCNITIPYWTDSLAYCISLMPK